MLPGFDRVLFGGQAECVVAERVQHVMAGHPHKPGVYVGSYVSERVAHMQPGSAGIREHVHDEELRQPGHAIEPAGQRTRWIGRAESAFLLPALLPSQIILTDAPSVLGWERWRAMDEQYAVGAMRELLQAVCDEGSLAPELVNSFAYMILAALDEIAVVIARAEDHEAAMAEGRVAVSELLRRLLTP
jgi:hypothetical protein